MQKQIEGIFSKLGGNWTNDGYPFIDSPVFHTDLGTPYLKSAGIALSSKPKLDIEALRPLINGFDEHLNFRQYLEDPPAPFDTAQIVKSAGQVCYASFGKMRTYNEEIASYINHLIESGHGSVIEHVNFSFVFWGISRSLSHELVRHRAGWAYSQLSQRYVSGRVLRFVERPEYQADEKLHQAFLERIDRVAEEYDNLSERLVEMQQAGTLILSAEEKRDLRKKVQQAARSVLPNETETIIWATANARALRHVIEVRSDFGAETEIRNFAFRLYLVLVQTDPILFGDYEIIEYPDGTYGVKTRHRKV